MPTLILYMTVGGLLFLFVFQNLEIVPIQLIIGPPLEAPLIVIVGISFFAGFAVAILGVIVRTVKGGRKARSVTIAQRRGK